MMFSSGRHKSLLRSPEWGMAHTHTSLLNRANPILVAFRARAMVRDAGWWADSALPGEDRLVGLGISFTEAHFDHAIRVLARLDTFTKGPA